MPKVILLDADGVVLKKGKEYFSERFAREYNAPLEEISAFFKNEFRLCQQGKVDLKEELVARLPKWGWPGSVEEYLEYWFSEDVHLDDDVLAVAQALRSKGVECFLATDQEKYRKEYLIRTLEGKLDGYWFSCDLGYQKSQPEFFEEILRRWDARYKPHEIAYWDDDQQNVDCARSVGIDSHFYSSLEELKKAYTL